MYTLETLEKKIEKIKSQMNRLGPMRPGSLTEQTRSAKRKRYGSYWQLSYTFRKKGSTEYIRDEFVDEVKTQIATYKKFKDLCEELVGLNIEWSKLWMKIEQEEK